MIRNLDEENNLATKITSILGTIISVGLNLTPSVLFYEFFTGKREFKSIPEMMFVSAVCLFLAYLGFKFGVNEFGIIGCVFFFITFFGSIAAVYTDLHKDDKD